MTLDAFMPPLHLSCFPSVPSEHLYWGCVFLLCCANSIEGCAISIVHSFLSLRISDPFVAQPPPQLPPIEIFSRTPLFILFYCSPLWSLPVLVVSSRTAMATLV